MPQPFVGEVRIFAGNFAPAGWMFCEGQLLPISENETLFQLIGTTYGGDGQSTFALPDLRGRVPLHQGSGFILAEIGGVEAVTLTAQQLPVHSHQFMASSSPGSSVNAQGNAIAESPNISIYIEDVAGINLSATAISPIGGNQPHENFQPYLCVNFIISLFGVFPSQT
ncbi:MULTISPECIES: phage tail protein [unclassified Mesorhizobium]|uniref:phage tail protein n=1 Tax=unclassified Mesorhizobium TaxID=325217 RepID=UPI00112C685A|nr:MULTISPECIES: tail fiber protein [unclassified Mesorhizobium]TPJ49955.1 phage tail protein [Mesorhizobium sp. B2-6-6]MBZ9893278.1 tail fiber protein [Mesorhizobium sp. BR1-1-6]MBZ9920217.1 tail fiber protein [Mesorhizobium sp. BR1-1-7]MBZ9952714.1 tail fiber protein [Mesorhizobium sp. BR1-1-15]MBZ9968538.1 tail fiber protein [Mesorhizobium sp. BR1-1-12]